ncbi:MAG TPA: DoxX family protein [Chitinophagaceae bacterium]
MKRSTIIRRIPGAFISIVIIAAGCAKIAAIPALVAIYTKIGLLAYLTILGIAEIALAVLFFIPATTRLGLLFLTAYYGGAMAVELSHGQLFVVPGIILSIIWLSAYLRDPGMFIFSARKGNAVKSLWME